ncbi:MAG: hypothetical protein Unbinned6004contig1002_3 [Prokaryotic dsDNA virus sp.]|nr:MAG: hypothetical protein Unbinned6004contig1002_3 [Prokaryotic dsDNA virus sp.]|tara:strand:- start:2823 stop:4529 length:1707 start_codon:yes stop_codon:yes gene_type:complete
MAEKVTIEVEADVKQAVSDLGEIKTDIKGIGETAKAQSGAIKGLAKGFTGVGFAMKAAGFGLIMKVVDKLSETLLQNQTILDGVTTAFNMIGIVSNKIIETFKTIFDRVTATGDNFDALGRLIKNFMTLALTPLKLTFNSVALVIKEVQLAWEKSWLGKGDVTRIKELTNQINGYKQEIKEAGEEAIAAGKGIILDFKEGIGEISKIGSVVVEEFNNTFEDVTVKSLVKQAKAITTATNAMGMLAEEHRQLIVLAEDEMEKMRAIRDDVSQTIEDRIKANKELAEKAEETRLLEIDALESQQKAIGQRLKLDKDNIALKEELAAIDTAILEATLRKTKIEKESKEQENALVQERIDNENQLNQIIQDAFEVQKEQINQEEQARKQLAIRTISDQTKLQEMLTKIEGDAESKRTEIKRKEEEAKFAIVSSTMGAISNLIGSETAVGKALAIGQAIINTKQAAVAALAPPPVGAGPIFGPIAAAGAIATGLANIKGIVSTKLPGEQGGSNPDIGSIDAGTSEDPLENAEPLVPTFGAIGSEPPPVQAFVVESDVSSSQALQNDLNLQATL